MVFLSAFPLPDLSLHPGAYVFHPHWLPKPNLSNTHWLQKRPCCLSHLVASAWNVISLILTRLLFICFYLDILLSERVSLTNSYREACSSRHFLSALPIFSFLIFLKIFLVWTIFKESTEFAVILLLFLCFGVLAPKHMGS